MGLLTDFQNLIYWQQSYGQKGRFSLKNTGNISNLGSKKAFPFRLNIVTEI